MRILRKLKELLETLIEIPELQPVPVPKKDPKAKFKK